MSSVNYTRSSYLLEHTTLAYELLKMRKSLFCEDGGEILISLLRAYLEALISS